MRRILASALLAVLTLTTAPADSAGPGDTTENPVELRFEFGETPAGKTITAVDNSGGVASTQTIVTAGDGSIVARRSRRLGGGVADFPAYDGAAGGARAVVAITASGDTDPLAVGVRPFAIGADVRLNEVNDGSDADDGNNVVQRGLYNDVAQLKLQIDSQRMSCRVLGDEGSIEQLSPVVLKPKTWYHMRCVRRVTDEGDLLVLKVAPIESDGTRGPITRTVSPVAAVGSLNFAADTPVSIGGKLNPDLTLTSSCDQFNGRLDNVILDLR